MQLGEVIEEVLAAHEEAKMGCSEASGMQVRMTLQALCGILVLQDPVHSNEDFRTGVRKLGELGYTYDTWHFFMQNQDYLSPRWLAPRPP